MKLNLFPVVVAAAMAVTACGGSTDSAGSTSAAEPATTTTTATSAPSGDAAVAWIDRVCGEIVPLVQPTTGLEGEMSDARQLIDSVKQDLEDDIAAAGQAISGLQAAGPSPIPGGDQIRTTITLALQEVQGKYQGARDRITAIDVNDMSAVQAAVTDLNTTSSETANQLASATLALETNKTISDAAHAAANCLKLGITTSTTELTS